MPGRPRCPQTRFAAAALRPWISSASWARSATRAPTLDVTALQAARERLAAVIEAMRKSRLVPRRHTHCLKTFAKRHTPMALSTAFPAQTDGPTG